MDNKIRKPKYDPYAEEYDADTGEKKILAKYDEDVEEKKRKVCCLRIIGITDGEKTFILGRAQEAKTQLRRDTMEHSNSLIAVSLDYDSKVSHLDNH